MEKQDLYTRITNRIVAELEKGCRPWLKPWNAEHAAGRITRPLRHNGTPYRGINILNLWIAATTSGYTCPIWFTYKQAKELGAQVRKGEKGELVVFASKITRTEATPQGEETERKIPFLKGYTVFNVEQIDGLPSHFTAPAAPTLDPVQRIAHAESFFANTKADIRHGGDRAFYRLPTPEGTWPGHHTDGDYIQVPHKGSFFNGGYYPTVLHELGHWSEVRLGWDREKHGYPMGELVAELSSCYLAGELGVPHGDHLENHAAYVKSWLESMRNDPSYVFQAAKQASKVTDYLLSFVRQPETEPAKPELVAAA